MEFTCPFCGYRIDDEYVLTLHIEELHVEDSPFKTAGQGHQDPSHAPVSCPDGRWIKCTRPNCGEYLLEQEIEEHLDLHLATEISEQESQESPRKRRRRPRSPDHANEEASDSLESERDLKKQQAPARNGTLDSWFNGTSVIGKQSKHPVPPREPRPQGRLGTRELGPHAFEKRMPRIVQEQLVREAQPRTINRISRSGGIVTESYIENETGGIIDVLWDVSAFDREVETTYLCRPRVKHVRKIRCEGNFCGYWNIQMLLSPIRGRRDGELLPNVLEIQDVVEKAWDQGICAYGRTETGGIKDTRKWIGSNEAVAYLRQTGVHVDAQSFESDASEAGLPAYTKLLNHVEAYFASRLQTAERQQHSYLTDLAPVFLQRQGHSVTIVGIQRFKDGSRDLLVFDPSFATARTMLSILDGKSTRVAPEALLRPYRRGEEFLRRWKEYEIVTPVTPS